MSTRCVFPLTSSRTRAKKKKHTHTARRFDKQILTAKRKESFGKTQRIVSASAYNSPVITVAKKKEGRHVLQRVLCSTKITVEKVEHRCVWERTQLGPSCSYASRDRERTNHTVTRHYIFSYYRLATAIQAASSEESLQLLPGSISACPENTALNRSVAR